MYVNIAIVLRDYMEGRTAEDGAEREKEWIEGWQQKTGWGNYDN